jgi:amino acid transporter
MAYANLKKVLAGGAMTVASFLFPAAALAQHDGTPPTTITTNPILNITEVLTGLAAAFVAFQAAVAYREGRIGRGITWVAVGMVIMAVGHFILVSRRFFHVDPLGFLGSTGSSVAFSLAVFASFISSAAGFYLIRKAADQTR